MAINTLPRTQILTKDQWLNVLSLHRASGWPSRYYLPRRKQSRYPISAFATLATASADGSEGKIIGKKYTVLDVSDSGLAIQSYQAIPPAMVLLIELFIGGQRILISGKVIHNTGFPGSFRVGIRLEFIEKDGGCKAVDS